MKHVLMKPDEGGTGGGAAAPAASAPAAAPPAAPAPAEPTPPADDTKGDWAPNWRELMAGGDEKELKQLGRYASPSEVWKKARALETRMSSGQLRSVLPENASAEELAAWRKEHGIPEKADGYDLKDVGVKEDAKPLVDKFLALAHQTNQTPEQVKAGLKFIKELSQDQAASLREKDETMRMKYEDNLRNEWGEDFRRNINAIHGLLDSEAPPGFKEMLLDARLSDGTLIGNHPDMLKMLLNMALIKNPVATIVPNAANPQKGIDTRIEEIEKMMRTDRASYNKDEKVQSEYRQLLEAREQLQARH